MMRLLILMACATSLSWAVLCTASVTGDWNSPATWGGACGAGTGGVPGDGDRVTIQNGVTLTIPAGYTATIGENTGSDTAANPAIQTNGAAGTGILVIHGKLVFKGPIRQGNATWIVNAGAIVSHGGTAGVNYSWWVSRASNQANAVLLINGTSGNHVTFMKESGADNAGLFGSGNSSYFNSGQVRATFVDVRNWGTATLPSYVGSPADNNFYTFFHDSTFTSSGPVTISAFSGNESRLEFRRNKFSTPLFANSRVINFGTGSWASTGMSGAGVRLFDSNVFAGQVAISSGNNPNDFTFTNNIFRNHDSTNHPLNFSLGSRVAAWDGNLIYSNAPGPTPFGTAIGGMLYNSIGLRRSDNSSADVDMFRTGTAPRWDVTLDGWVLEFQDCGSTSTIPDTGGDAFVIEGQHPSSGVLTFAIRNTIFLPNEDGGSNGTSMVLLSGATSDWSRMRMVMENSTAVPRPSSVDGVMKFGEGSVDITAMQPSGIGTFRSNLVWRPASIPNTGKVSGKGVGNIPTGAAEYSNNGFWNLTGDPYDGLAAAEYSARGTNDVSGDPRFPDGSRDFGSWALSVDSSLTSWELAVAAIENTVRQLPGSNANLTVANALAWIRHGYVPQNPRFWSSGYNGTYIGAGDPRPLRLAAGAAAVVQ